MPCEFEIRGAKFQIEFVKEYYGSNVYNEYKILAKHKNSIFRINCIVKDVSKSRDARETARFLRKSKMTIDEDFICLTYPMRAHFETIKLKKVF